MNLKLRLPDKDREYQTHKALNPREAMLADWKDRIVEEFTHFAIIENKFPWDRITRTHHLLIPKRKFARAEDMTEAEEAEWKTIRKKIGATYDMFIENLTGTLGDIYHPHLINLLEETDPVYFKIMEEVNQLKP